MSALSEVVPSALAKRLAVAVGFFLFLFPPTLQVGGYVLRVNFAVFLSLAILCLVFFLQNRVKFVVIVPLALMVVAFFYAFVVAAMVNFADLVLVRDLMLGACCLLAASYLVHRYLPNSKERIDVRLLRIVVLAGAFHGLFIVLLVAIPPLQSFYYSIIPMSKNRVIFVESGTRIIGFTGTGASASAMFSCYFIATLYYMLIPRLSKAGLLVGIATLILTFTAIVLTGRTGIFLVVIGGALYLLTNFSVKSILLWFVGLGSIIGLFFALRMLAMEGTLPAIMQPVLRTFNMFMAEDGSILPDLNFNTVTYIMENFYFVPQDARTMFFGSGNFGQNDSMERLNTDVGYIRQLFGVGIVGSLLAQAFYFWFAYVAVKNWRNPQCKLLARLLFTLTILWWVMNTKELQFHTVNGFFQLYCLVGVSLLVLGRRDCPRRGTV